MSSTTANVTGLPTDGSTVHVTLWSLINGSWQSNAYTYTAVTAAPGKAAITNPSGGATLAASSQPFTRNTGTGVSSYSLWVGTTAGAYALYATSMSTTTPNVTMDATSTGESIGIRPIRFSTRDNSKAAIAIPTDAPNPS